MNLTRDETWLANAGHIVRSSFHIISIVQFIPQTLLNLLVIISTIITIYQSRICCKPVFLFILNQAVADFALAIVVVVVINLRYQPGDDDIGQTQHKCHVQIGVWLWIVLISIFSTGMLTLDRLVQWNSALLLLLFRFLYITTTIQYNSIVTNTRVVIALLICWIFPSINAVIFIFTYKFNGDIECILGHSVPSNLILTLILLGVIMTILIYVAYTLILIKFYKRKRRLQKNQELYNRKNPIKEEQTAPKEIELEECCFTNGTSTPGQSKKPYPLTHQRSICPHHSDHSSLTVRLMRHISIPRRIVLFPGVSHLLKSITAAKYILTTVTALSVTWTPWLVTMSMDIFTHYFSYSNHINASTNYQVWSRLAFILSHQKHLFL